VNDVVSFARYVAAWLREWPIGSGPQPGTGFKGTIGKKKFGHPQPQPILLGLSRNYVMPGKPAAVVGHAFEIFHLIANGGRWSGRTIVVRHAGPKGGEKFTTLDGPLNARLDRKPDLALSPIIESQPISRFDGWSHHRRQRHPWVIKKHGRFKNNSTVDCTGWKTKARISKRQNIRAHSSPKKLEVIADGVVVSIFEARGSLIPPTSWEYVIGATPPASPGRRGPHRLDLATCWRGPFPPLLAGKGEKSWIFISGAGEIKGEGSAAPTSTKVFELASAFQISN